MKYIKILSLIFISTLFFTSCVDQEFDEPPFTEAGEDPTIDASKIRTMDEIKGISGNGGIVEIKEDVYIQGIVISDDKPGNFYKVLYLQDEKGEGGVQISIDATELHASFPLNRRVFIKLKGLFIGKNNNAWAIGIGEDDGFVARIPQALVETFLFPGKYNVPFEPKILTIDQLDPELHGNTLIILDNIQFSESALGNTFADEDKGSSRDIEDCNENSLVLRTSNYADFQSEILPSGNGKIRAVFAVYRDDGQLLISTTDNIEFTGDRCGGTSSGNETLITLAELRSLYSDGTTQIPDEKKIRGVVISDQANGNAPHSQNIVIQDATGGIEVRFSGDHSFSVNDDVEIVVSNGDLGDFKGTLQVNNVSLGASKKLGTGSVVAKTATIQEVVDNIIAWQSTLVKIEKATIESGTFNGNKAMDDATGSMILRTGSFANFEGDAVPSGEVTVTGIVSIYNETNQLKMRSRNDVSGGGTSSGDDIFKDDFESGLAGWISASVTGDQVWELDDQHGNPGSCAKISGYADGGSHENEDWLISSAIDLSSASNANLSFETAMNYTGNELEVFISTDYIGSGAPTSATWTAITFEKSTGSWEWVNSGNIDLSSYAGGNIYVGFKFTSSASASATWELDNVLVK